MSDDARAGRMAVRFSEDDKAWLAEQAEDEGVEPATLVRLIINRLRRGRPLLMSMVTAATAPAAEPRIERQWGTYGVLAPAAPSDDEAEVVAEDVLAQRLSELGATDVVQLHTGPEEVAAIPLRRLPRQQYNPGRN